MVGALPSLCFLFARAVPKLSQLYIPFSFSRPIVDTFRKVVFLSEFFAP